MALKTLVKLSNVNNLSDARYAAGMGVELIGFDLDESSENYVDPDQFHAITNWISGVKFVGELSTIDQGSVDKLLSQYKLDYIQLHAAADYNSINFREVPVLVKIDSVERNEISEHPDWTQMMKAIFRNNRLPNARNDTRATSEKQIDCILQNVNEMANDGLPCNST